MYGTGTFTDTPMTDGALGALDQQLDRFQGSMERLHTILMSVTASYPEPSVPQAPRDGPDTPLRARLTRLADGLDALDRLMNSIDL